ncbi:hypothetical protein TNCV_4146891 [Trichonephila clavipes]|nr:hypothetical protein TNCV_4146891 [Trichonephila clavipes]
MMAPVIQLGNGLYTARFLVLLAVWVSEVVDLREFHCSIFAIGLHVLPGKESTETGECRGLEKSSMD